MHRFGIKNRRLLRSCRDGSACLDETMEQRGWPKHNKVRTHGIGLAGMEWRNGWIVTSVISNDRDMQLKFRQRAWLRWDQHSNGYVMIYIYLYMHRTGMWNKLGIHLNMKWYLSISLHISLYLSISLSLYLSIYLSIYIYVNIIRTYQ